MSRQPRHALPPIEAEGNPLEPKALSKAEFGRRLMHFVAQKGWNQAELARQADIGRDSISNYVNGHQLPGPKALNKLCEALGVTREQLLPNSLMFAVDAEEPAIELKQAPNHPDKAWLRINRAMSFATAAAIIALIKEEDAAA